MAIAASTALWFLPFVLPICFYVAWSDMRAMRIPNYAVIALAVVFLVVGLVALPLSDYPWRLLNMGIVLLAGMVLNAAGLVGAGDAKFTAAAAPFIDPADMAPLLMIFAANVLAAFVTHRLAKHSALRQMAPEWESWTIKGDFPMGFALGGTLGIYLILGAFIGQ